MQIVQTWLRFEEKRKDIRNNRDLKYNRIAKPKKKEK